jgi:putative alpha-1,2-mannosidase
MGVPLFDKVTLSLPGEKRLTITAEGNAADTYFVNSVHRNGDMRMGATIQHADLMQGGSITFKMSGTPPLHSMERE